MENNEIIKEINERKMKHLVAAEAEKQEAEKKKPRIDRKSMRIGIRTLLRH